MAQDGMEYTEDDVADAGPGWRLLFGEVRRQWKGVALGVTVGLLWTAGKVSVPRLVQAAVDRGLPLDESGVVETDLSMDPLVFWALVIAGAGLVAGVFTGSRRYFAMRVARWVEASLRERLFAHVQRLHFAFHDRMQAGQLMSRGVNDLQQAQSFVVMIPITISNFATVMAATVIMLLIDVPLTLLAVGALPLINILAKRFSTKLHPKVLGVQQELAELSEVVEDSVSGIRVVKGFGAEGVQNHRLQREARDVYDVSMEAAHVRATYVPALEILPLVGVVLVLWYGGYQVINGSLSVGALIAFQAYVFMLVWPLRMLGMIVAQAQRAAASAARVAEVLATAPVIEDAPDAKPLPAGGGEVRFVDVTFNYAGGPENPVLDHLDLHIPAGQSVALVGPTGCGKTTVARLVPRFYDVDGGTISIDGMDVREARVRDVRRAVGIVFEETFLFTDTIRNNIAFADPEATWEQVQRAARLAGAHEFISEMPEGYDTEIGERGFSLSGGQRQRVAIARAILADPRILILDDATSSVDPTKEHEIRDAMTEVMAGRTTIVIAHRSSTIALADRVVLLDRGRVLAEGTHDELLATSPEYRRVLATADAEVEYGEEVTV